MANMDNKQTDTRKKDAEGRYFTQSDDVKSKQQVGSYQNKHKDWKKERFHNKHKDRRKEFKSDKEFNKNKTKHSQFKMGKFQDASGTEGKQQVYKVNVNKAERRQKWLQKKDNMKSKIPDQISAQSEQRRDPYPGEKPIPKAQIQKYERGKGMKSTRTRSQFASDMIKKKEAKLKLAAKETARTEFLMQEEHGFLEAEDDEDTTSITQHDLAEAVDITSAQKFFDLKMKEFGPYRINYTRNGRFLLFGGVKGHIAAIDWMTKKLLCEINVMESVHDVKWLHQETMYAVAQKQWTYIYDNQGIELHCLKVLDSVLRMEFLPYHFLLATSNAKGYLSYIDVSVGEKVARYSTGMGRLDVMCQNPANAVVALGHSGGTVTQWCPKLKEPVVKMLCHNSAVRSVTVDKSGTYMATSGIDRTLKIWDLRTYKMLQSYKVPAGSGQLSFSQKGLLASCMGNIVQVYKDCCTHTINSPYLVHDVHASVQSIQFCPYEDVLGVGHAEGFTSLIVPGAGEPNFDALESNPYQTKKQRQETEVKMLLDKIPAEMIHIDSNIISQVDKKTLEQKIEEHNKLRPYAEPMKMDYEPKYKKKGRSKGSKLIQRKKGVMEEHKRKHIKQSLKEKQQQRQEIVNKNRNIPSGNVLDRFKKKT